MPREIARVVVMEDVWFRDKTAGDRPVLATISVLDPMKQAGQEVGHQHCTDYLQNDHNSPMVPACGRFRDFPLAAPGKMKLAVLVDAALIDKNRSVIQ